MHTADLVLFTFTALNMLQIVSYLPQIVRVLQDENGASAISYWTWSIWAAGTGVTTAYALINIWDVWIALVNAVHTVCCLAVIGCTAVKRHAGHPRPRVESLAVGAVLP